MCSNLECFNATITDDSNLEKEEVFRVSVTLSEEEKINGISLVNTHLEIPIEDNDQC